MISTCLPYRTTQWVLQISGCCLSVNDRLPNFKQTNKKYFWFWSKMFPGPTAYSVVFHMTSMDICCNDLWFMPETELHTLCPKHKWLCPFCQHLALLLNWSAITEVSWWMLPLSPLICLNPRCFTNANSQQLTQMVSRNTEGQAKEENHPQE